MSNTLEAPYAVQDSAAESQLYTRVALRLIPFLFICYVFAYLDRVNIGFAKLQMLDELKFSETIYGLGAGIFFLGYFIFEVPSNIILHRVGARRWIARIMISWGILSASMIFVQTPTQFYVLRFLLGLAEAGFFPGIILYLTYWFPPSRRGKITAMFMTGIPMAGVIGGPLSGWIMASTHGLMGHSAWQWLFFLEALPSIIAGVVVLFYLQDKIDDAKWLSASEKETLKRNLEKEGGTKEVHSVFGAFRNKRVWVLSSGYFGFMMGLYGVSFWLPSLIKSSGIQEASTVSLLTTIPYAFATAAMIFTGRSADRSKERRWHAAVPAVLGATGLVLSTLTSGNPAVSLVFLSLATMGIMTGLCQFWCLPPAFLGGAAAAAGIAMINSVGNLAGFISPYMIGWVKDVTSSTDLALYCIAGSLIFAAFICLIMPKSIVNR
ncbi:MFS transporter [Pseudomonas plecoglossicida]|uniref:Putative tartrate transporter n=2 Tax=Pseudomonas putida group TaxID=136845 RepID=A0A2A3M8B6_PSEDL|nr:MULTISPECIES: MFS transporter [Pseudomonas]MEE1901400.1 MFS transporter [Pseudomonas inefficax]KLJ14708.1 MFS transporter [Pseudomonas sp. TJI-51]MBF8700071.1 MFS transporter [Pseudomonas putida]MBF8734661.1 MFS transporter [Pseudomonas putida]MBF8766142.1 MFS transporter [Pseudomonas putida]